MINLRLFLSIFSVVFLAELGDKTQLATMLFASERNVSKWTVFGASSLALVAAAGLAVLVGGTIGKYIPPRTLKWVAGLGFIAIGIWTVLRA